LEFALPAIGQTEDGGTLDGEDPLPDHEIGKIYLNVYGNLLEPATVEFIDLGTGTAEANFDYNFNGPLTIIIPAGDYTDEPGLIGIPGLNIINDDKPQKESGDYQGTNLPEDQIIKFRIQNPDGNIILDDGDGNNFINFDYIIKDDGDAYVVTSEIIQQMNEPGTDLLFKMKLNYPVYEGYPDDGFTMFYTIASNEDNPLLSAEEGVDFNCTGSPSFTYSIGEQEKNITSCHIIDDILIEGNENFNIIFSHDEDSKYKFAEDPLEDLIMNIVIGDDDNKSKGKSGKSHKGKSSKKVCKDSKALNFNNIGQHDKTICEYSKEEVEDKKEEKEKKEEKNSPQENGDKNIFNCDIILLGDDILEQKSSMDVLHLQEFLNKYEGEKLEENGEYDQTTIDAVNRYQVKYSDDILQP
jgi:hypothetical protein